MEMTTSASGVRVATSIHVDEVPAVAVHDSASGGVALWLGPILILGSLRDIGNMIDEAALKLAALSLEHAAREDAA